MKPTNTSESGGTNEVTHGMATLSINPSQPSAIIMHPRPGMNINSDVLSALSDPEPSTMHTQSSPPRPSTKTTMTAIPSTSSSPAGPKVNITYIHPSRIHETKHFPQIRQHPQPFPGHYKPHRHHPFSQTARARPCEKHTAAGAHHMRNRHQSLMRMGDMDHALAKHTSIHNRNRMKLEHLREERRDLTAKLRALKAKLESIDTLHRELTLGYSMSSLPLTAGEPKPLFAREDKMEHLLAGIRGGTNMNLVREGASMEGGDDEDEDIMEE